MLVSNKANNKLTENLPYEAKGYIKESFLPTTVAQWNNLLPKVTISDPALFKF